MSFLKNLRGPDGKPIDLSTPKTNTFRSGGSYAPVKTIPGNPDVLHRPMMRDFTYSRSTAAKALRSTNLGSTAFKATATKGLGALAGPVAGAILGANELRKNVPVLAKGIPAYMKERKAAKDSASNLKTLRAQAAGKLKSK